jgi:hypothetical protein
MNRSLARSMVIQSPWLAPKLRGARPLAAPAARKGIQWHIEMEGGSGEAHQWRNSAEELVNRVDDEVMQQRLEVCAR